MKVFEFVGYLNIQTADFDTFTIVAQDLQQAVIQFKQINKKKYYQLKIKEIK